MHRVEAPFNYLLPIEVFNLCGFETNWRTVYISICQDLMPT